MNNNLKMSLQEFATAVSQEMAIDKKNVSAFIDEFQKLIVESLEKDKIVKINGLGTFKLVWVNPRKSVNVSTGEPIEIEGHYKLNFSPDKSLQESINIDDSLQNPLKKMAQQAEEMKDILKDMQLEEENKITPVVVEESLKEEEQKEENKEQIEDVKEEKPLIETSSLESFTPQPVTKKTKTSKKSYAWLIWVSVVCILLLTFGFVYYLYSEEINAFLFPDKIEVVEEPKQEPKPQPILISEIDELAANRTYTEFLTEVKLRKGTRLAYFAKEYYGHPDFWVYIYEANIDKLKKNPSPSQILIGTEVKIPKMPAKLVDATSKEAVAKAVEIAQQYINAEK